MSESSFLGFGEISRPDIGLISDSFQNLSEIFELDKRDALRNIQIKPEILDSLYGLYSDITREDLRAASGLDQLLLPSLDQLSEVFLDRIPTSLYINKEFYNTNDLLGGAGSSEIKYPNVILYNGAIQCEGAQYNANVLGPTLLGTPTRQSVAMSTSRASLFNAELDTVNVGYFKSAKYSGSIRVRRRSHVNRIFIPKTSFLTKPQVQEKATHTINVSIDNGNTGTTTPVKLLTTKNTPLKIYCRLATGSIDFKFSDSSASYFYGLQIQPAQQRPNSIPIEFLPVSAEAQTVPKTTHRANIDINSTGYQNLYDLYLYLYLDPLKVTELSFNGIDMREFPDRKDLGLVGLNNLRSLTISGGSLTILPLWLKTLKNSLETLDLADSGDTWRSGLMGYFDFRDPAASPSTAPLYTGVSYLTVPETGPIPNENRNGWSKTKFQKYILNESRTPGTDFRVFSALKTLRLGDRFYGKSARFDDVFPNLEELSWSRPAQPTNAQRIYTFLFTALPKIKNNGKQITYSIANSGASGLLTDIGTSTTPTDPGHISKYKMRSFNIGADDRITHNITGYINDPAQDDWVDWKENCIYVDIKRCTNTSINIQSGAKWSELVTLDTAFSDGVKFQAGSPAIKAPKMTGLYGYGSNTTGPMGSLGTVDDTAVLEQLHFGASELSAITEDGINFLLPETFAPVRPDGNEHKMVQLNFVNLAKEYSFRRRDLENLYNLVDISINGSRLTGRFPIFPLKKRFETDTKRINLYLEGTRFYDLRNISISPTNTYFARDINYISAWSINSTGGGVVPPDFEGTSTCTVRHLNFDDCLTSTYPSDWVNANLRRACILNTDPTTTISGLSITRSIPTSANASPEDSVFKLTGGSALKQKVLVNDIIRDSSGTELAKVLSVPNNTTIIIDRNIATVPGTLVFHRNGVDISDWFKGSFPEITVFRAGNCRLFGRLRITSGFNKIVNSTYSGFNMSSNMISDVAPGTIGKIFDLSNIRQVTIDLSNNNLSVSSIQSVIDEISGIDKVKKFTGCLVKLSGNKLVGKKYSNYSQQEIFPTVTSPSASITTSLFRLETFEVYNEVTVVDEDGVSTTSNVLTTTKSLQIPGALISGTYYKTRVDATQKVEENPLGIKFKNLSGIKVDLGFTYISPKTEPSVISSTYTNQTTRNASITDSGLTALPSCPGSIVGICWRNSSNQILKLLN